MTEDLTLLETITLALYCTVQSWERSTPARRELFAAYATWSGEPYESQPFYPLFWMLHVARHA